MGRWSVRVVVIVLVVVRDQFHSALCLNEKNTQEEMRTIIE